MPIAIIKTGGKQYVVEPGKKIKIEKIETTAADTDIVFNEVLLVADGEQVRVGTPTLQGASVSATVARQARDRKVIVFKYHNKTRYRKKRGHRQHVTEVVIGEIKS